LAVAIDKYVGESAQLNEADRENWEFDACIDVSASRQSNLRGLVSEKRGQRGVFCRVGTGGMESTEHCASLPRPFKPVLPERGRPSYQIVNSTEPGLRLPNARH
jgi:hypothetical protein